MSWLARQQSLCPQLSARGPSEDVLQRLRILREDQDGECSLQYALPTSAHPGKRGGKLAGFARQAILHEVDLRGAVSSREIKQRSDLSLSAALKQVNASVDEGELVPTEPNRSPRQRYSRAIDPLITLPSDRRIGLRELTSHSSHGWEVRMRSPSV